MLLRLWLRGPKRAGGIGMLLLLLLLLLLLFVLLLLQLLQVRTISCSAALHNADCSRQN